METALIIVTAIFIVFGILQIILFFKIWGMTDDTKKIKNMIQASGYPSGISPAKIEFIVGNTEKAKEMAIREFICDVFQIYSKVTGSYITEEEYIKRFNSIEKEYRDRFDNVSSFITFGQYSTFQNAKKIFD